MAKNKEQFRYQRRGTYYVLTDASGKPVKRLEKLPSLEDPDMKKLVDEAGISHFIMGNRWYIVSSHVELETISAPVYDEDGKRTGEIMQQPFITEETIERAKAYWKNFIGELSSKGKVNKN